jgi:hypothetical protein
MTSTALARTQNIPSEITNAGAGTSPPKDRSTATTGGPSPRSRTSSATPSSSLKACAATNPPSWHVCCTAAIRASARWCP